MLSTGVKIFNYNYRLVPTALNSVLATLSNTLQNNVRQDINNGCYSTIEILIMDVILL